MRRSTRSLARAGSRLALVALLSFMGLTALPVCAGETLSDLAKVSARPNSESRLPLATTFTDQFGNSKELGQALDKKPAVLLFVDYACRNMCSAMVLLASNALANSGLVPGDEFGLLAIGLAPDVRVVAAREFKDSVIDPGSPLSAATQFFTGDAAAIKKVTDAVGYHYSRDGENAQFAHAATLFVISGEGKVMRAIPAANVDSDSLHEALVGAQHGAGDSSFNPINLLCYGYAASHGGANRPVRLILETASAAMLIFMAGIIFRLARRARPIS